MTFAFEKLLVYQKSVDFAGHIRIFTSNSFEQYRHKSS